MCILQQSKLWSTSVQLVKSPHLFITWKQAYIFKPILWTLRLYNLQYYIWKIEFITINRQKQVLHKHSFISRQGRHFRHASFLYLINLFWLLSIFSSQSNLFQYNRRYLKRNKTIHKWLAANKIDIY